MRQYLSLRSWLTAIDNAAVIQQKFLRARRHSSSRDVHDFTLLAAANGFHNFVIIHAFHFRRKAGAHFYAYVDQSHGNVDVDFNAARVGIGDADAEPARRAGAF